MQNWVKINGWVGSFKISRIVAFSCIISDENCTMKQAGAFLYGILAGTLVTILNHGELNVKFRVFSLSSSFLNLILGTTPFVEMLFAECCGLLGVYVLVHSKWK